MNASSINTVVVCVLTSNVALARAPGNTLLSRRATGLPRNSVANASQIAAINKSDLEALVGILPTRLLDRVSSGNHWFLKLDVT